MSRVRRNKTRQAGNTGFSLIELLFAMIILAVGLIGGLALILGAIASNGASRYDTAAVALAQSTLDRILAQSSSAATQTSQMTDCAGHTFTLNTAPGGSGSVNTVSGMPDGNYVIDFSQSPVAGYQLQDANGNLYYLCATGVAGSNTQIYDVRWFISTAINGSGSAQLVEVAAKNIGEVNNGQTQSRYYVMPITLRAIRGN